MSVFRCHANVQHLLFDLFAMESKFFIELTIEALAMKEHLQLSNQRSH